MASQAPIRSGMHRLETNIPPEGRALPNPRFSFATTPPQLSRSTSESFSSPTTTIEDTPTSTQAGVPAMLPIAQPTRAPNGSLYFDGRSQELLFAQHAPPPPELHPANFAPFSDEDGVLEQRPHRLTTIAPSNLKDEPVDSSNGYTVAQDAADSDKSNTLPFALSPKTPAYNPQSLSGPNPISEVHMPGQVSHPRTHSSPKWKRGLCVPDGLCCFGLFCPCTLYGKTQYRLSQRASRREATDLLEYDAFNGSCGLMAVACGLQGILAAFQRTRVRKLYQIDGSVGDDCIVGLCCCCCVLEQNEREMRDRENFTRTTAGLTNTPYSTPGAMSYPPPPG